MEDNLHIIPVVFSIVSGYIMKIGLLAGLIMKIAMNIKLQLVFGR